MVNCNWNEIPDAYVSHRFVRLNMRKILDWLESREVALSRQDMILEEDAGNIVLEQYGTHSAELYSFRPLE